MSRTVRLYEPREIQVAIDGTGRPTQIEDVDVVHIREEWLVEEGWWTAEEIKRRYFELVLIDGRDLTVFRDLTVPRPLQGRWFAQRA